MANSYATERWLRARLKEHGDALRGCQRFRNTMGRQRPEELTWDS